ncbi:MAG: YceI family protein [Acidobacteria bacterium]|nr:YceI family protein [Acidobacteriota bacterium]MBI3423957.1 YceI family protein [Acidobacteriota bacterium]
MRGSFECRDRQACMVAAGKPANYSYVMHNHETASVRYKLEAGQSRFTVQAFASGLLASFGHNPLISIRDFNGEVQFAPGTLSDAAMRLEIKTASFALLDEVKEKDRREIEQAMFNDVLEITRYPEIIFQSTQITVTRIVEGRYKARVIGDLTLHGIRQSGLWIAAQFALDGDTLRAQGDFALKQTDYKIKLVSVAGGALKIKDELKFTFDLLARKEQA